MYVSSKLFMLYGWFHNFIIQKIIKKILLALSDKPNVYVRNDKIIFLLL